MKPAVLEMTLGGAFHALSPQVGRHFQNGQGPRRYNGVMSRVWRRTGWRGLLASGALRLSACAETLFSETGEDIPFEIVTRNENDRDGKPCMSIERTFFFPRRTRRFVAVMSFDPARRVIVDFLGRGRRLEVELHAWVQDGALCIVSGKQWLRLGRFRCPLPRWAVGTAHVREWQHADGQLAIRVVIENRVLGPFFGYEGVFQEAVPARITRRATAGTCGRRRRCRAGRSGQPPPPSSSCWPEPSRSA